MSVCALALETRTVPAAAAAGPRKLFSAADGALLRVSEAENFLGANVQLDELARRRMPSARHAPTCPNFSHDGSRIFVIKNTNPQGFR